jgi:hypothetical protein
MRSKSKTQLVSELYVISLPLTRARPGKSSDLYLGFQCFAADTVSNFLFATCFDQLSFPDFQGDIVKAVDTAMPTITLAKFSVFIIWIIRYFPPSILMLLAPSLKGVVIFKESKFELTVITLSHNTNPILGVVDPGQECHAKSKTVGRSATSCHIQ